MFSFYKDVIEYKGKLLVRGVHEGKEFKEKVDFKPTLYAITQQQTNHRTLQGQYLKPITFDNIYKCRDFKRNYTNSSAPLYGNDRYHFQYIAKNYPSDIQFDKNLIKIFSLDIEVTLKKVSLMSKILLRRFYVLLSKINQIKTLSLGEQNHLLQRELDVTYIECQSEKQLLMEFFKFWTKNYPDVITGWNTKFFDLPYLCNRIKYLVGDKVINKLSLGV